jgi:hypothetical protein
MSVYLGRDRKCATATVTVTYATISGLTIRIEYFGHKLNIDSFFFSPDFSDNLFMKAINFCGTVRLN